MCGLEGRGREDARGPGLPVQFGWEPIPSQGVQLREGGPVGGRLGRGSARQQTAQCRVCEEDEC